MKFLVTGGAGFIGSNIVEYLLGKGEEVVVLDNFHTGKMENLQRFLKDIEFHRGSILNPGLLRKAMTGCDYVLHEAAIVDIPWSIDHPEKTIDTNVKGTFLVLQEAERQNVKRVINASSASVYGMGQCPMKEDQEKDPLTPYAASKLAAEKFCRMFRRYYGLSVVSLRYFNVYGPRVDPNSQYSIVIHKFMNMIHDDKVPPIYGDGKQRRDFVYAEDVADVNYQLCLAEESLIREAFNVGTGNGTDITELARLINAVLGKEISPEYQNRRDFDPEAVIADVGQLATAAYGENPIVPATPLEKGLKVMAEEMFGYSRGGKA